MNINNYIKLGIIFFCTISCTFFPLTFEVSDNCIILSGAGNFRSVHIERIETRESYYLTRDYEYKGTNKICFSNIPIGYDVFHNGKLSSIDSIPFQEGEVVIISHLGGDRSPFKKKCTIKNGQFQEIIEK